MPSLNSKNRLPSRITRPGDFRRIIRTGKRHQRAFLQLYYLPCGPSDDGKVGFIVPDRAAHGAVKRNRVRRMIKEGFRLWCKYIVPGHDIILRARNFPEFDHSWFAEAVIIKLLTEAKLLTRDGLEKSGERLHDLPDDYTI
ncbi:MAG TPA: ribonuclease P protein component [Bacteroidetes bacterium]|nr:ribonuclease P protein component [Bacteroidota bacterium]